MNFLNRFIPSFLSIRRLLVLMIFAMLTGIIFNFGTLIFFTLTNFNSSNGVNQLTFKSSTLQSYSEDVINKYDFSKIDANDLSSRIHELLTIRASVLKELRHLERNRSTIIQQINDKNNELDLLKNHIVKKSTELERLQLHIKQSLVAQKEAKDRVDALIEPPLNLLPKLAQQNIITDKSQINNWENKKCSMHNCFDYSRCSLFSPFYVYIYNFDKNFDQKSLQMFGNTLESLTENFKTSIHITQNPNIACVYMVILSDLAQDENNTIQNFLYSLPHWGGDGRNHIIINSASIDLLEIGVDVKKAMCAQSVLFSLNYRNDYDFVIPYLTPFIKQMETSSYYHGYSPFFSPAKRKYFLTFLGRINNTDANILHIEIKNSLLKLISKHTGIVAGGHNEFLFDFDCDDKTRRLCDNQTIILIDSTFTLILPPISAYQSLNTVLYNNELNNRLFTALAAGSIPVLLGGDYLILPFENVIDWSRAVIRIPIARITEMYVMLKTFSDADIIEMKRYGSYFFQNYLSSLDKILFTLLAFVRHARLQIPAPSITNEKSSYFLKQHKFDLVSISNQSNSQLTDSFYSNNNNIHFNDDEENLGPLETPFYSLVYRRNFSISFTQSYSIWNEIGQSPFYTFPSLPTDPILPSESKFIGSSYGFRPIAGGLGGSGREFAEAIGGNFIREQFTIVILTYERENVLLDALQSLKNLPYLNKVLVIWNSQRPPSVDIKWPEIGVDIVVIKAKRNSLNNRFLPYDDIKTDAILSIDDDTNLRHDEIIFAFRVWREARDRIVGFPARYHSWDSTKTSWFYNSSHTCEFSMILTGAAFFHKYYSYLYTYSMPSEIRDKVDEYMNCEDIAMNFLVSHFTRKPPIKVTSRWTFRCPQCLSSLSEDNSHFEKRHKCINYFSSVYGYMPLLYSQFRADSVLFKTRIPNGKQKCFKYI